MNPPLPAQYYVKDVYEGRNGNGGADNSPVEFRKVDERGHAAHGHGAHRHALHDVAARASRNLVRRMYAVGSAETHRAPDSEPGSALATASPVCTSGLMYDRAMGWCPCHYLLGVRPSVIYSPEIDAMYDICELLSLRSLGTVPGRRLRCPFSAQRGWEKVVVLLGMRQQGV